MAPQQMKHQTLAVIAVALIGLLSACRPSAATTVPVNTVPQPTAAPASPSVVPPSPTSAPKVVTVPTEAPTISAVAASPSATEGGRTAWLTLRLVDARNGNTFTFADFKGKTVYVEIMATWCPSCYEELANVRMAKNNLNDDRKYEFVAVSSELELDPKDLAVYSKKNGFDWTFVVAPLELMGMLDKEYGLAVLDAPSTPHFLIYPDGSISALSSGRLYSADELIQQLTGNRSLSP